MDRLLSKLTLFFLLFSTLANAQTRVRLRSGDVLVPELTNALADSLNRVLPRFGGRAYLLLQLDRIPDAADRKRLEAAGIELEQYLSDLSYTATVSGPLSRATLRPLGVRGAWAFRPEQKIDPALLAAQLPDWTIQQSGTVNVLVRVPQSFTVGAAVAALSERGFRVHSMEWSTWRVVGLQVPITRLRELAQMPFIDFVQPEPPREKALNSNSRSASRANALNGALAAGGKNLNGAGVVLGIGDDADPQSHVDFSGRLIPRAYITQSNHGVHTTGTMAGAGILDERYRGYASKATIISQTFSGIISNAYLYYQDYGMRLTNNSYGNIIACDYHGTYDIYAQLIDQQASDIPELLHVFAAGNSGNSICSPFLGGYHTVLGGWQSAKNVLSIGATDFAGSIYFKSSRGPVRDGRLKPDLMAPGINVISSILGGTNGSRYEPGTGTSMAAPAVTGGLALLQERYTQLFPGTYPQGALLKALLCNGAADRGTNGPDFQFGYGWMDLLRSVDMLEKNHYYSGDAVQGGSQDQVINVPANTAQLKVMLYWHDPAASLLSPQTLVNDLDLEVRDLSNGQFMPYRLDTSSASLGQAAFAGADHINNMEQVVIDNPPAGDFIIRVKGTAVTQSSPQRYFVVYDPVPVSLQLTNPIGSEPWTQAESVALQWEAFGNTTSTYALSYSTDDGTSWTSIATGLSAVTRTYFWTVPAVTTATARVKVTQESTGATSISNAFAIMARPTLSVAASSAQCEGYIVVNWTAVAGATDYEVMLLQGSDMVAYATTSALTYTFEGMDKNTKYWFSVRPRINGVAGRRAIAYAYQPNSGTCSGTVSDGDLKLAAILTPATGRQNTSGALTAATPISVEIKNLDDAPVTGYTISYRINGGSWNDETIAGTIAAQGTATHTFSVRPDLLAVATYLIEARVANMAADIHTGNDTARVTVRQLANPALTLPLTDNLETLTDTSYATDITGLSGDDRFDYQHGSTYARLRTQSGTGFARSGTKALTLDQSQTGTGGIHYLIATLNLSQYHVSANDIRLDFRYISHGSAASTNNKVWIRGSDQQVWLNAYDLFTEGIGNGVYGQSQSIRASAILRAGGQEYTSSFQIRWGQEGSYPATEVAYVAGYSIDDIRLYEVNNDLEVRAIIAPGGSNCALSAATPVKIVVRNNSTVAQSGITVSYAIAPGSYFPAENLGTIAAGDSLVYQFARLADLSGTGAYTIQARVEAGNGVVDDYSANDTAVQTIINSPLIQSYPYLEHFESSSGNWYTGGTNSSWQWGAPSSQTLTKAASGLKVWKSGLTGNYNDREYSYLYSPCFDISGLSQPTLSFALALDLEDCGTSVCDAAWVEYSSDGVQWFKLGTNGAGTNWYNKGSGVNVWSRENYLTWRVASIPLPANNSQLRLRFVLSSDEAVSRQGIAIDDIHIYDNVAAIYTGTSPVSDVQQLSGSAWVHFNAAGKRLMSVNPNGGSLGQWEVNAFIESAAVRYTSSQYYLNRSFTVKPVGHSNRDFGAPVTVRLYFTDAEIQALMSATGCSGCSRPSNPFLTGITKYSHRSNLALEDNSLANNDWGGDYTFFGVPSGTCSIVPYDQGYYAEISVSNFSEFWFNSGGPTNTSPLPVRFVQFTARREEGNAVLNWEVGTEEDVEQYEVEVAESVAALQDGRFIRIGSVAALGNTATGRRYTYTDARPGKSGTLYYRLRVRNRDGSAQFSAVRPVSFGADFTTSVYPNPSAGIFFVSYRAAEGAAIQFRLLDAQGRTLRRWNRAGTGFMEKIILDLEGPAFPPGMYLLQAETGGTLQSLRLFRK